MSHFLENFKFNNPFIVEGIVLETNDPMQMGRVKVMCPSVDSDDYSIENIPWAEYASPLSGTVTNHPSGRNGVITKGFASYGFWAIPKIGSQVLVFFLNGDSTRRFFFASYFDIQRNRGIPAGRNTNPELSDAPGPWSDTYEPLEPAYTNLKQAFNNQLSSVQAQTRGVYERQAAQPKTEKDGTEGYQRSAVDQTALDSQVYCWVTPGHHAIIMSDDPKHCRVRLKTAEGNQIIFDDTNERIYISTARGGSWIELDEDGHISVFGADSISVKTNGDFNVTADGAINLEAATDINMKARSGNVKVSAGGSLHLSVTGSIFESCCGTMNLSADGGIIETGATIHFNGPTAACASPASPPTIVPGHEPWLRPTATKVARNPNWRP